MKRATTCFWFIPFQAYYVVNFISHYEQSLFGLPWQPSIVSRVKRKDIIKLEKEWEYIPPVSKEWLGKQQ
jgi:hypothetical protein